MRAPRTLWIDASLWLGDDHGQLVGAWSTCRAAFIPKLTSYAIANHRPMIPSDPMEAVVSRALPAQHLNALEPL